MPQLSTIRVMARMVARQSIRLQQNNRLCLYAEGRFYAVARPTATSTSDPAARIHRRYSSSQFSYSTSAPPGKVQPPDHLDDKERQIFDKLVAQLEPSRLEVQDVSGGCGSMYAIEIASPRFKGLTMMKQHRLVQGILDEEIKGWHGLQLRTKVE
ncbi:bola protein [Tirmania nivea]|nr:bola protein [Tirmania nivea]